MRFLNQLALASVSVMALAAPAFAQDNPAAEPDNAAAEQGFGAGEDIVVTARRKDESLQDVPLTVNAVTSESIEKLNLRDLKDIAAVVPGLVLEPGNRTTGAVSSLRGLNVDVNSSGQSSTVQFYLNDSPISGGAVIQSIYDIGQIEVLRGPQGTLRGLASPSGSITITTRRPDMDEWGGYAQGTVNTIGGVNVNGAVNVPLIPNLLAIRVAGLFEDNESNRVRSINSPADPSSKTRSVRISARLTPTDSIEVNASYQRLLRKFVTFDQVESANLALGTPVVGRTITARDRLAVEDVANVGRQAFDFYNWQAKWSFAGQRLDYVGSYIKQDFQSTEPTDKGDFFDPSFAGNSGLPNNNFTYTTLATGLNVQNSAQAAHTYVSQESHELRLSSEERVFGMFDYVVGAFLTKQVPWTDLVQPVAVLPPNNTLIPSPAGPTRRRGRTIERAVFGNLTAHLGESTEISGGVRYINFKENTNNSSAAVPQGPSNTFEAWVWSASLKHRFNDDLMAYATAGSSWRVGSGTNGLILLNSGTGIQPGTVVDPYLASLFPTTPERSKSYEIGIRSTWFDKTLTVNVSAFHQDFQGYILPIPVFYVLNNPTGANPVPLVDANVTPTRATIGGSVPVKIDGIEGEIAYRPSENLSLGVTLAYAKSKINNAVVPCTFTTVPTAAQINANGTTQVKTCTVNQSAGRIAPFTASFQGEYQHPISDSFNGFVRGLVRVYGNSSNDAGNPFDDVPAYALANLYAGVRSEDGAWEIAAYGKNIFNTFRVLSRNSTPENFLSAARVSNYRLVTVTEPREFGITAKYAFGSR